ncbi:hypothetical protein [uncultured Amphritea sp.]|uniref:hypothetical protein n=1 Tax=uncultured Amphritea sp. TaxID=981605 RepID=UPI0025D2FB67|nr:hypothetical protein [uncultured Amphritea sp.]
MTMTLRSQKGAPLTFNELDENFNQVELKAASAAADANRAELARDAALLSDVIYVDTASGLAAVAEGSYFSVPSASDDEYLILYRHDAGAVATEIKRYPTVNALDAGTAAALTSEQNALLHATAAALSETNATDKAAAAEANQVATAADRVLAEQAAAAAQLAEGNAVAVVTGGTASLPAAAGMIPIADAIGHIDDSWLSYTIPALTAQYPGLNVVASCFYDTSKDSDGGAWIHRTAELSYGKEAVPSGRYIGKFPEASAATAAGGLPGDWFYHETGKSFNVLTGVNIGVPIYRAGSATFPAQALIVAEAGRSIIFDASGPELTMWANGAEASGNYLFGSAGNLSSVAASNGIIAVGSSVTTGVVFMNMASGQCWGRRNDNTRYNAVDFTDRNSPAGITTPSFFSDGGIAHSSVNHVAMTTQPTAPIDPATGLKIPTIAVATNGGVSVIRDDGAVVDSNRTDSMSGVSFGKDGNLYYSRNDAATVFVSDVYDADNFGFTAYSTTTIPKILPGSTIDVVSAGEIVTASINGVSLISKNPSTPSEGMVAHITDRYNTGWMVGDCQLAALCETETGAIVETERVTNGTFDVDTNGWAASNATLSVVGGKLRVTCDGAGLAKAFTVVGDLTAGFTYKVVGGATLGTSSAARVSVTSLINNQVFDPDGLYFVATGPTAELNLHLNDSTLGVYSDFDNISVKQVVADHSGNDNHLDLHGTLSRAPIGNGEIAAWSGFSAANYLEIPYSSDFDFGTGDFYIPLWSYIATSDAAGRLFSRTDKTGTAYGSAGSFGVLSVSGDLYIQGLGASYASGRSLVGLHKVDLKRVSGTLYIYLDGFLIHTQAAATDISSVNSPVILIGAGYFNGVGADPWEGSIMLLKAGSTPPSDEQIAKAYRDELAMIQGNAVLSGNDPDIKALAYDKERDLLHAASASTVSSFRGLERVDSTTPSVGTISALDAQDGSLIISGSTGVDVDIPAVSIRERLAQALPKPTGQTEDFYFTGDGTNPDFSLPKGWKPKRVWIDGGKVRKGVAEDYTIKSDGFVYSISFGTAPALNAEIDVEAVSV